MNTTRATRPIPLCLTALVAFFSAVAVIAQTPVMDTREAVACAPTCASCGRTTSPGPGWRHLLGARSATNSKLGTHV